MFNYKIKIGNSLEKGTLVNGKRNVKISEEKQK